MSTSFQRLLGAIFNDFTKTDLPSRIKKIATALEKADSDGGIDIGDIPTYFAVKDDFFGLLCENGAKFRYEITEEGRLVLDALKRRGYLKK